MIRRQLALEHRRSRNQCSAWCTQPLLRVSDGDRTGPFQYLSNDRLVGRDNYLSSMPDALGPHVLDDFCEIGVFVDAAVAMHRLDGSVWSFPELSGYWWMGQIIERVSSGMDEYLRARVFSRSVALEFGEDEWAEILDLTGTELSASS